MSDHPQFAAALVLALDVFCRRARSGKRFSIKCRHITSVLAKFFEYLWISDIYNLSGVQIDILRELIQSIGRGGWQDALCIRERLSGWVLAGGLPGELVSSNGKSVVTERFCSALGTNANGQEAVLYAAFLDAAREGAIVKSSGAASCSASDIEDELPESTQYSQSTLREVMTTLNYLFDLPLGVGTKIYPFPDIQGMAKRHGRGASRTKNLGIAEAGKLLAECVRWIYQIGPRLVELVRQLSECVIQSSSESREVLGHNLDEFLRISSLRAELDTILPGPISGLDSKRTEHRSMTVRSAIVLLQTAVFVVVATMNARRRDEVIHRKYGIHQGFIVALDAELGLFKGEFYVEKTLLDYDFFYVNQITVDACSLLETLQEIYFKVDHVLGRRLVDEIPPRERSLFSYRRMSRIAGIGAELCWYEFDIGRGVGRWFVQLALGADTRLRPHPHMFRRFYALVYYYQYSNATLQALSQQMGHRSLLSTLVYVTDGTSRKEGERIKDVIGSPRAQGIRLQNKATQKELDKVSDELLFDTVLEVLEGTAVSGGYPRYIRHVHRMLLKSVDYDEENFRQASKRIVQILKSRGHEPQPMPHGQCNAGRSASSHLAACGKAYDRRFRKELTSPITCSGCSYQSFNEGYLEALKIDLASQKKRLGSIVGVERLVLEKLIKDTESVIFFHMKRMGLLGESDACRSSITIDRSE
ncbi:site-specific integrase [Burkholderia seminalis]|uniref:hypothetical protein n=1 Tax=Burkholderia seminalis TaxID=488731 RepID=UPI001CF2BDB5|nr:hypothetical protein [Burkholderia seminalis]